MTNIPVSLKPFFQEYDFNSLSIQIHKELLIERTLAYGNREEIKWLLAQYPLDDITNWIKNSGSKRLPKRRFNLWRAIFDLPPKTPKSMETGIWQY